MGEKARPATKCVRHWGRNPSAFIQSPAYMVGSYVFKTKISNNTQEEYGHDEKTPWDLSP
ncbi:MAG: hypothetical protein NPIRA04_28860 [Nitrospirales bacterium]|nr:MAG: hypothetical protein NPIRA04_28860 [Nitrospirales bacterium]